ncbi:RNA polymerase sigma factor SigM [Mycobacterium sp. C31M]
MGDFDAPRRTDEQLLSAHVAGDPVAFAELFGRYRPQLFRLARSRTNCSDDAHDVLQDAMLSAHCGAAQFRHDCSVRSWLYRIVLNACRDRLRRHRAHPTLPLDPSAPVHTGDPTPRIDTAIVVERALMRLPLDQRAAVVAVDMQGFSVAEAAELLGVPEGTVKSRRARARSKLAGPLGSLWCPSASAGRVARTR